MFLKELAFRSCVKVMCKQNIFSIYQDRVSKRLGYEFSLDRLKLCTPQCEASSVYWLIKIRLKTYIFSQVVCICIYMYFHDRFTSRHSAHTFVLWLNPKQWLVIHIPESSMKIKSIKKSSHNLSKTRNTIYSIQFKLGEKKIERENVASMGNGNTKQISQLKSHFRDVKWK